MGVGGLHSHTSWVQVLSQLLLDVTQDKWLCLSESQFTCREGDDDSPYLT